MFKTRAHVSVLNSFKNSLVIHEGNKANQYHDGDFIPDKTYRRQKEY